MKKDIPSTIANPGCHSPSSPSCLYENCLDDPYEDIFLPCVPSPPSGREEPFRSPPPQELATSMIEVEYGLFTTYILIDGSKEVPFDYSLQDDLLKIFASYKKEICVRGNIYKPLSSVPSVKVKNLSAVDTNLLLLALNAVLINPFNKGSIDALYFTNVEIDTECGRKLQLMLPLSNDLQNLWFEYCQIDDQAYTLIMQGEKRSKLKSFWLLDGQTDFRLPPAMSLKSKGL
ncbi:MAG: hypothetical protein K6C34_00010 [Alphaproteobacteria bacterium]|nr:hypothetical protein [Alphaproteobacteria bacterium]